MFLDIRADDPLLPRCEPAAVLRAESVYSAIKTCELVYEQGTESFEVKSVARSLALDQALELEGGVPQRCVLEEQSRSERSVGQLRVKVEPRRIEIKMHVARVPARLLPFVIFVAGGHERQLPFEAPERRPRQPFNERLSVAAFALLMHDEQVHRRAKTILDFASAGRLQRFRRHAMPCYGAASHSLRRRDLNSGIDLAGCRVTGRQVRWMEIGLLIVAVDRRRSMCRKQRFEFTRLRRISADAPRIARVRPVLAQADLLDRGLAALVHRFSRSCLRGSRALMGSPGRCSSCVGMRTQSMHSLAITAPLFDSTGPVTTSRK